MEKEITSEAAMREYGASIGRLIVNARSSGTDVPRVIELIGDIGAGKTTFVKGLAVGLGADEEVSSPSFTISRVYEVKAGLRLYHYDFYRLTDAGILRDELREVSDDADAVTVVEWADIVEDVLPEPRIRMTIRATGESSRHVIVYGLPEGVTV